MDQPENPSADQPEDLAEDLAAQWLGRLRPELDGYARLALDNIGREFPCHVAELMTLRSGTPKRPCRTWWATTTWSPTGSRRTPS